MKPYRNAVTFTGARDHTHLLTFWLLLAASLVLSQPQLSASEIFTVSIDTAPLVGAVAGPFSLDFQFTNGGGLGDGNNTLTLSGSNFGSGAATGAATLTGGAAGSLSSQIVITDSAFFNEAFQTFTPGGALSFSLSLTTNLDSTTPDELSIGILDHTLSEIPTLGPGDAFLVLDLNSSQPVPRTFASDIARSPLGGGGPINIPAPLVSTVVPEPGTNLLAGAGLILVGLVMRRSIKRAASRCQKYSARSALIALLVLGAAKGQAQTITATLFIGGIIDCVAESGNQPDLRSQ